MRLPAVACVIALLVCGEGVGAEEPAWRYPFQPGLELQYELVGTYHSKGLSTQRITPQGDSGGGPTISAGGNGLSVSSGNQPPLALHDGGGSGSLRVTVAVDEVDDTGKAKCSVQIGKMAGRFDGPGMQGRCLPLTLFPQIHGRPFRAILAPDGGVPELVDFEAFVREQLGAETPPATIELAVRETRRALAACFPALPEAPVKKGASYKVGEYAYKVGPQQIIDGKAAVFVVGDAPGFEREREEGKLKTTEKGGSWSRFYYGKRTGWSLRYEERHWRDWSQKARTVLGQRTDMTETITFAASLEKIAAPKPESQETEPTPEDPK